MKRCGSEIEAACGSAVGIAAGRAPADSLDAEYRLDHIYASGTLASTSYVQECTDLGDGDVVLLNEHY